MNRTREARQACTGFDRFIALFGCARVRVRLHTCSALLASTNTVSPERRRLDTVADTGDQRTALRDRSLHRGKL